MYNFTKKRSMP